MGFRNDAYATVWETEEKSNRMTKVRLSITKKNKETGEFDKEFSGFVSFVGSDNAAKALCLNEKDRIKLNRVDVTTRYDKEKEREYVNYLCYEFEKAESIQNSNNEESSGQNATANTGSTEDAGEVISDDQEVPF